MNNFHFKIIILLISSLYVNSFSQVNKPNPVIEWTTWTLLQTIPSPTFYHDKNEHDSKLIFGIRWNITPVSYCFNMNKFIPKFHLFKVNPLHRHSGSVELFIQPEFSLKPYKYSEQRRFFISAGTRVFLPLIEFGEYLSFSAGMKYSFRSNKHNNNMDAFGIEGGFYSLFGIVGLQLTYNFANENKYNISLYIKYY